MDYDDAKNGVRCTICGREKTNKEITDHETHLLLKAGLETGDIKFKAKITITK